MVGGAEFDGAVFCGAETVCDSGLTVLAVLVSVGGGGPTSVLCVLLKNKK